MYLRRAGRSGVQTQWLSYFVWARLLAGLVQTEAYSAGISEELIENAYWRSRHASAQVWQKHMPGSSDGTLLALGGHFARFWDLWGPAYTCPYLSERIGQVGDGGKWVCGVSSLLQRPGCMVLSIGSNGETSFEEAVLSSTACDVHTFDHTLDEAKLQAVHRVPGINFHAQGLSSESSPAQANLMSLTGMLNAVQRQYVDVLKVDMEGGEWEFLLDWYKSGRGTLPVGQLLIEFHYTKAKEGLEGTVAPVFEALAEDSYRVFATEPNYYCKEGCCARDYVEYAFIKVSKHGRIYSGHAPLS